MTGTQVKIYFIGKTYRRIAQILGFFEIRQDVVVAPTWIAKILPVVEITLITSNVPHEIHRARAAHDLTTRPGTRVIFRASASHWLRLRFVRIVYATSE